MDIKNQTVRYTMCIRSERRETNSKINKHYLEVDVEVCFNLDVDANTCTQ